MRCCFSHFVRNSRCTLGLKIPGLHHDESILKTLGKPSKAVSPPDKMIPGGKAGDEWVGPRGMVYCWCPPGKFTMGSPETETGRFADETQREVVVKEGFWMAKYEWPRGLWRGNKNGKAIDNDKLHPVNMVSQSKDTLAREIKPMNEAAKKAGLLPPGWEFGLPSEIQWEYAARAGTQTRYFFGNDMAQLVRYANFADKSYYDTGDIYSNSAHRTLNDRSPGPSLVGNYLPNPWGLHDIYGNVSEWCENGKARGGSRISLPENCRSAYRDFYSSRNDQNYLGYRLVIRKATAKVKK